MTARALLVVLLLALALLPAAASASPYSDAVSSSRPAGWWRLGEPGGTAAAAASGPAAGSWTGPVRLGEPGAPTADADTAATLPANAWLNLGTWFAPSGSLTVEAWARPAATGITRYVLSKGTTTTGFHLYLTSTGAPAFRAAFSGGTATVTGSARLALGSWHHLAGSVTSGVTTLYVDGERAGAQNTSGGVRASTQPLTLGRYSASATGAWSGSLDEPAVYDRALDGAELADHAARGRDAGLAMVEVSGPARRTAATVAAFLLSPSDPGGAITCALDSAKPASCAGTAEYAGLREGDHELGVTVTDRWGRAGTAARYLWTIDHTAGPDADPGPPSTTIAASVPEFTTQTEATFALNASGEQVRFACSLDDAPLTPCGPTVSFHQLGAGQHVLRVRAVDRYERSDRANLTFGWTVDHTAPDTAVLAATAPTGGTAVFASTERGGRFECRANDGAWAGCATPWRFSAPGATVAVRALDAAGNADPVPASARLPEAAGNEPTGALAFATAGASMTFAASSRATLACRLDAAGWSPCAAPLALTGLSWGWHGWRVKADFANGMHLEMPELRWDTARPPTRLAALQFPLLLHRGRDGRVRARNRVPHVLYALNVAVTVRLGVDRLRGRRARPLGRWTMAARPGQTVTRLPANVTRRLRRGRYRVWAQAAGGARSEIRFAVI